MVSIPKQDAVDAEIGERLHVFMWRNRIQQNDLAALLGISHQSLGRKLRGDSAWSAGELARLARTLRVSVGWLFGETEEEPARPKGLEPLTFWSVLTRIRARLTNRWPCLSCGRPSPASLCDRCEQLSDDEELAPTRAAAA